MRRADVHVFGMPPHVPDQRRCLPRPSEVQEIRQRLLSTSDASSPPQLALVAFRSSTTAGATATTTTTTSSVGGGGLVGLGGVGKTTLASMLVLDPDVQARFRHGIFWISLRRVMTAPELAQLQSAVLLRLRAPAATETGDATPSDDTAADDSGRSAETTSAPSLAAAGLPVFDDPVDGKRFLSEALSSRSCLLVLDDVWTAAQLDAFSDCLGPSCALLATSRQAAVLRSAVSAHGAAGSGFMEIQTFSRDMSEHLLRLHITEHWSPSDVPAIVDACGGSPLALSILGAAIAGSRGAWQPVLNMLHAQTDVPSFGSSTGLAAHESVRRAMWIADLMLRNANSPLSDAYRACAVFPEGATIPVAAAAVLWDMPYDKAQTAVSQLADRSLVSIVDREPVISQSNLLLSAARSSSVHWFVIHDLASAYLHATMHDSLTLLHQNFVNAYARRQRVPGDWSGVPADGYFHVYIIDHLRAAGKLDLAVDSLLTSLPWLQAKLAHTDANALVGDLVKVRAGKLTHDRYDDAFIMEHLMKQLQPVLLRDPSQLGPQLRQFLQYLPSSRLAALSASTPQRLRHYRTMHLTTELGDNVLGGHLGSVLDVKTFRNGQFIVTASDDLTLRVWEYKTSELIQTLCGHEQPVTCVVAPTSNRLVSGSFDRTLRVWNNTGHCLRLMRGHRGAVTCVTTLPQGLAQALSAPGDDDDGDGQPLESPRLPPRPAAQESPRVAPRTSLNRRNSTPRRSSTNRRSSTGRRGSTNRRGSVSARRASAASAPDDPDPYVVSGSWDCTLRVWRVETGRAVRKLEGHSGKVLCVATLPPAANSGHVVSGSRDMTLRVWDIVAGTTLHELVGHSGYVLCVAVLPDGDIVSGSDDRTIRLWSPGNRSSRVLRSSIPCTVTCLAVATRGQTAVRIVSGGDDETLRVWDADSGKQVTQLVGHNGSVEACIELPDGRIASGSTDFYVRFWDTASHSTTQQRISSQTHTRKVTCMTPLMDGRLLTGSADQTMREWDVATGQCLAVYAAHTRGITCVLELLDGRLVSGSKDRTVRVWDRATHTSTREIKDLFGRAVTCSAEVSSSQIIVGSYDKMLSLIDVNTGKLVRQLQGHTKPVSCVVVVPECGLVISGAHDDTLRVWNPDNGACMRTLRGHTDSVTALAVVPDIIKMAPSAAVSRARHRPSINHQLSQVVSGARDQTVRLWDIDTGAALAVFDGHASMITCLAVLPSGLIVSGSEDKTIRVWNPAVSSTMQLLNTPAEVITACAAPGGIESVVFAIREV